MKTTRLTEKHILRFLKEAEAGMRVCDLCREHDFGECTFYE